MNPLYPALIVLCVCSVSTASIAKGGSDEMGLGAAVITSVWTIAACSLASIGLSSGKGTAVATVLLVLLVGCAIRTMWRDREEYE